MAALPTAADHAEKKSALAAEQQRPDILARRWEWIEGQFDLDPDRLAFIDETWASTNMARTRGRAPRGERLRVAIPHGHWKTTTFVADLHNSGMAARMVLDGPINGVTFQAYVDQVLVPDPHPGDIVIMDNLGSHKRPGIRSAIEAAGASLLYCRPTAPTSIPSKAPLPSSRPCCAKPPSATLAACGMPSAASAMLFSPVECANYFSAAGYDPD